MVRHAQCVIHASCITLILVLSACTGDRTHDVEGRIVGFGDGSTLIVEHGDVPGLMPAMTMSFNVRDSVELDTLRVGDAVAFVLHVGDDSSWIRDIRRLPDSALPAHPAGTRDPQATSGTELLETGDRVPDVPLLTHADTTLRLTQLEGRSVVLTFIYTRCPLPDYCPRMVENFIRLQKRVDDEGLGPIHFVGVTFDPAHDTPPVLREYADRYEIDLSSWTFATGDSSTVAAVAHQFGVYYSTQGDELVHNLSTALIGPDGRIRRIWRGNDWTIQQVVSALRGMDPA